MILHLILFWEFFKIGLFAAGGGLATLPFLYQLSFKTGWFTTAQIVDMIAVSEITPGPLGINMATFAGFNTAGISGGLAATFGLVMPSLIIMIIIAGIMHKFTNNKYVQAAFSGLRACVCALITIAVWEILKISLFNFPLYKETSNLSNLPLVKNIFFFILLVLLLRKIKVHPAVFIFLSAILGLLVKF